MCNSSPGPQNLMDYLIQFWLLLLSFVILIQQMRTRRGGAVSKATWPESCPARLKPEVQALCSLASTPDYCLMQSVFKALVYLVIVLKDQRLGSFFSFLWSAMQPFRVEPHLYLTESNPAIFAPPRPQVEIMSILLQHFKYIRP